jgi:hypothetical protein
MKQEEYQKGFGTEAIEKGFITQEQLIEGMEIQVKEEIEERTHRPIGTILKELGHMTVLQIDEIYRGMKNCLGKK